METTRQIYWNIKNPYIMYILALIAAGIFGLGMYRLYARWKTGSGENSIDNISQRIGLVIKHVFGHVRLIRYPGAGFAHYLLFSGFIILFAGTFLVFLKADLGFNVMHGRLYLYFQCLLLDIAGIAVLAGLILFAVYRYLLKSNRYRATWNDFTVLFLIFAIITTGFMLEGIRLQVTKVPWAGWSPIGLWISGLFNGTDIFSMIKIHRFLWWLHLVLFLTLFAWIPYSKLRHIFLGPVNIFFCSLEHRAVISKPIDFEKEEKLGVETLSDFSWKHLFDLDVCTECGRCQEICPVYSAGQNFSPRDVLMKMRSTLHNIDVKLKHNGQNESFQPIIENSLSEKTLWYCRTCRACMEECPVFIEIIPKFIELRRYQVMENAQFPETLQDAMRSLESRGHPYRGTMASRITWCNGLDVPVIGNNTNVEVLYWVGCTTALNEEPMSIGRALVQLFNKAGISYGIMGEDEACCGEPARRIGNEYLFEMLARKNIELLKNLKCETIVTNCPHCYNMLRHEYRQFGADFEVYHHSEFLLKMIKNGRLKVENRIKDRITYHDPCYLGRFNSIYDEPRELLRKVSEKAVIEMERAKDRSLCCGGGGGGAWNDEEGEARRVNSVRAKQALKTSASILATACPFCMMMLKDGMSSVDPDGEVRTMDIAQLLLKNNRL